MSISIDKVQASLLSWDIDLKGIHIQDSSLDTLFYAQEVKTKLYDLKSLYSGNLNLGSVSVDGFVFKIKTLKGGTQTNLDAFVEKISSKETTLNNSETHKASSDVISSKGAFNLETTSLKVKGAKVVILDENNLDKEVKFDQINFNAKPFVLKGSLIETSIKKLSFETSQLNVRDGELRFSYSPEQIRGESMVLKTEKSQWVGSIVMDFQPGDFQDFYNKVLFHVTLKDTKIATDDLNLFYPEFKGNSLFTTSAQLDGSLNNLTASIGYLNIDKTGIRGQFGFKNLFEEELPFKTNASIKNIETSTAQLRKLMPRIIGVHLPDNLDRLGRFNLTGSTEFSSDEIKAKINAQTQLGSFYSDIAIEGISHVSDAKYTGFLSLIDFNLGTYLFNSPSFSHTTMDVNIQGQGFFMQTANTKAEGLIYSTTYNQYTYRDISVSGLFKKQLFDGILEVADPNCQFEFKGLANFSNSSSKFNFTAHIDHADLHRMNFVKDSIAQFQGKMDIDMEGTSIDDIAGVIDFTDTHYLNSDAPYNFEDFRIEAKQLDSINRSFSINSKDIITGAIKGNFKISEFPLLFRNAMGSMYTYYKPYAISEHQQFDFNFNIYNKLVEVFLPKLRFSPNTRIKGSMIADEGDFKMDFRSPSFEYYGNKLDNVQIKIDTKNPLYKSYVEVAKAKTNLYTLKDFKLINNNLKDTLFFRTEFKGESAYKDAYQLNFYHTFNDKDESVLGLKRSNMRFKGSDWTINPKNDHENKVVLAQKLDSLTIDHLTLITPEEEEIKIQGHLADSTYKDLQVKFNRVALHKITPDIDSLKLDGRVSGMLSFQQKDSVYYPSTSLAIEAFSINDFVFGNLDIDLLGNQDLSDFIVNAKIKNEVEEQLRIIGNVYPREGGLESNLLMSFNHFNLAPFSPLGSEVIQDIRGSLFGNAKVTGSLKNPDINGELTISRGGIAFPYLQVNYDFGVTEQLKLHDQTFDFVDFKLSDTQFGTKALLKGQISHRSFQDWTLNLNLDTENNKFLLLNTKYVPESLYYGTGFLKGKGSIVGPTNSLLISIDGSTDSGTSIKIPIEDAVSVGDDEFISFVEKSSATNESLVKKEKTYSGLDLAFNLDITPEAEVEIVIDPSTGSSLKGTGSGKIFMDINTSGKFNMFGDYTVYTGSYNYKFGGFIDKTFKVKPGGRINWEGDPLQAQLDLQAAYALYANPAPLLENPGYTKRIPTEVIVRLNGALENPNIDFDIEFPGTNSVIKSELLYSLQDPTVQDRNAFFLLAQGTFVNDATGINQQAVTGNLLQSASGFLSSILDGSSDKFNFGLSYEQGFLDRDSNLQTDNKIGVSLSTQLSDRVLFNGRLGVPVGGGVSENVVAGDAELQILLNETGTLSAKVFNRENEFQQFLLDRQGYTQGVGLTYRVDFNTLSQLVRILMGTNEN